MIFSNVVSSEFRNRGVLKSDEIIYEIFKNSRMLCKLEQAVMESTLKWYVETYERKIEKLSNKIMWKFWYINTWYVLTLEMSQCKFCSAKK